MKIQDVRFQSNCFKRETDRPLSQMLSNIGHHFLSKIKYQFEVENTHILLFTFGNIDDKRNVISNDYFRLGDEEIGHWRNLTHTFQEDINRDYPKIDEKSQTKDNIMDYDVPSLTWFKIQLEKMDRN